MKRVFLEPIDEKNQKKISCTMIWLSYLSEDKKHEAGYNKGRSQDEMDFGTTHQCT